MNFKKILASVLATSLVASAVSISAFAATTLNLTASKTKVARGDEFTITLPMNAENTRNIQAVSAELKYDEAKFEFVLVESDFVQFPATVVNATGGVVRMSNSNVAATMATGRVFEAKFRVKADALGGIETFSMQDISIADATEPFFTSAADVSPVTIEIKAPEKLATPAVTIGTDKKATWTAVANAVEYNVSLLKNDTEILNKNQAATDFDFSSYVTETANYDVIVKANQNGSLHLASDPSASAAKAFLVEPTITPATKEYVKGSGGFDVTMTLNGNTFDGIEGLTDTTDYIQNGNVVHINESALTADKTLTFKFSNTVGLSVTDKTVTVTVKEAADAVTLVFAERENAAGYAADDTTANDGTNDGLIVVTNGTQPVVNFLGAQFTVTNTADVNCDKVEYDIVPANGYALLYDEETGMYEINVKPVNGVAPAVSENTAGEGIVIGKLVRKGTGYGKGTIAAGNITITVEKSDNSYRKIAGTNFTFLYNIPEPTETLNVNVDFSKLPTEIKEKAYQKMALTLYSARLGSINFELGSDATDYTSEDGKITATQTTAADNKFSVKFTGLPAFEAYTVSIKGDGYRDAKAQFVLNEETTVNFWNNAYESGQVFISKVGGDNKLETTNFLAGDVIMNGVIDLYDLSAVSSYFGKRGLTADTEQYIQYDLNRDGKVDITDITMLLAGWAQ